MTIDALCASIACLGPVGYMKAPGTMATLCTIPLVVLLSPWSRMTVFYSLFLGMLLFIGRFVIVRACHYFNNHQDPSCIVLDEFIGCIVAFWAIPITFYTLISGFVLFRFFDISKVCGIAYLETYKRGWGIVLDDVAAGIMTNILLRLLF